MQKSYEVLDKIKELRNLSNEIEKRLEKDGLSITNIPKEQLFNHNGIILNLFIFIVFYNLGYAFSKKVTKSLILSKCTEFNLPGADSFILFILLVVWKVF